MLTLIATHQHHTKQLRHLSAKVLLRITKGGQTSGLLLSGELLEHFFGRQFDLLTNLQTGQVL